MDTPRIGMECPPRPNHVQYWYERRLVLQKPLNQNIKRGGYVFFEEEMDDLEAIPKSRARAKVKLTPSSLFFDGVVCIQHGSRN